jgi:hypothetical protein
MNNVFTFQQLLESGGSIFFAAFIALYRFRKLSSEWLPVMLLVSLAAVNEVISIYHIRHKEGTNINNNIYVLLEALLILWHFKKAGIFTYGPRIFIVLFYCTLFTWAMEIFFISGLDKWYPMFRILSAMMVVGICIYYINILAVFSRSALYKDAHFIIAIAFLLFFSAKVITEIFWISGQHGSIVFQVNIFDIFLYINLFVNILYAIALLCIPAKYSTIRPSA